MAVRHFFSEIADHAGAAYLRYSFTKGTDQEVDFLIEHLGLAPGMRVLDVGCGPGRHSHALADRGLTVLGVDISDTFIDVARRIESGAEFVVGDARRLADVLAPGQLGSFDAAISLCQGGFGLPQVGESIDVDRQVLDGMCGALAPGGRLGLSAFSAYFQLHVMGEAAALGDKSSAYATPGTFDAARGVHHEVTEIRNESGAAAPFDLWTRCYTPTELRLLLADLPLDHIDIQSVAPGDYAERAPTIDHPEFLVRAVRIPTSTAG